MPAIRDPIHYWIYCSDSEQAVIDTPLFQRLNWVSQLTLVKSLYPGGTHTRFSHSLGAMKVAGDYMKNIFRNLAEKARSDKKVLMILPHKNRQRHLIKIARFCGLLHDIGHGPFSHAFDRAIYNQIYDIEDGGHDKHRAKIIRHPSIVAALALAEVQPGELLAVWDKKSEEFARSSPLQQDWYSIIRAVIGGPLGADRIDFTMRDSYFTGTQHAGTIARDRILYHVGVTVSGEDGRLKLSYNVKVIDDMIQALDGRHWMYNNVYLHKTSTATHILIERMLRAADKVLKLKQRVWNLEKFAYLNENTLMGEIMSYPRDALQDKIIASTATEAEIEAYEQIKHAMTCCKAIFDRRYPKMLEERRYQCVRDYEKENPFSKYLEEPEKYAIIKTRYIAGVDPLKFEKYGIVFEKESGDRRRDNTSASRAHEVNEWDKEGENEGESRYLTCQEILDGMDYVPAQKPYFFVRVYSLEGVF